MTTCAAAIKRFEEKYGESAVEAKVVKLYCQIPPIVKLDSSLNSLAACEHLQLSTNSIDKIAVAFTGLKNLKILSLGRNVIKKIEKLDDVAENLEELWVSYNQIGTLDGLQGLVNLKTLYISNNNLKSFAELDKVAGLANLRDVLLTGNPMYEGLSPQEARIEILRRLPNVAKIDGQMVLQRERDEAADAALGADE
ncbi:hypothetical protein M885DRAFT_523079 [Pelagophyceae sp. CCMP2097]|nr:hypothetical protein M885DRAFT_523079 [Pelagophyceae sp. CCMP2097]